MTELHIGWDRKDKKKATLLPVSALKRHLAALGASGSGKTVLVKCVMEECIRAGIPLLMVDLQGDLASLALMGDKKQVEKRGTPGKYYDEIADKAQVAIYTPASSKGIPISMNPLKAPPQKLDPEDFIQAVDSVAETVASILGYNTDKGKGADVKNYLYLLLESIWNEGKEVKTFGELAKYIKKDSGVLEAAQSAMLNEKDKATLAKGVTGMTIGSESLLFNLGMALDVERMMRWQDSGKTPVNVVYLNTLRSQDDKVNFIADLANQVYNWMLRNPSEEVQLVFILDELAGLVPPIRNPPSKKSIQLLLKQARKYGVSLLLATQNISDVDYKSLGQVSTWALGKLIARQDIEKVKDIISAISPAETDDILSVLPRQTVGQFMLLNPDVYDSVQWIQARWLVTDHTTLDESKVKKILDESGVRAKFPDAKGKTRKVTTEGGGSPLISESAVEDEEEEEEIKVPVPQVDTAADVLPMLDEKPIAISAEDLAERTGESTKDIEKELDKLVKSKKLEYERVDGVKIYWSKKHKMDPSQNLIGPFFEFYVLKPRAEARSILEARMRNILRLKKTEEIDEKFSNDYYVPLYRIAVYDFEELGGGFFKKKEKKKVTKYYYVNGMTGQLVNYNEKEQQILLEDQVRNWKEFETLPDDRDLLDPTQLGKLNDEYLRPKLNREEARNRVKLELGGRINRKEVIALCWIPFFQFRIRDKLLRSDIEGLSTEKTVFIDGVFGTYMTTNPIDG